MDVSDRGRVDVRLEPLREGLYMCRRVSVVLAYTIQIRCGSGEILTGLSDACSTCPSYFAAFTHVVIFHVVTSMSKLYLSRHQRDTCYILALFLTTTSPLHCFTYASSSEYHDEYNSESPMYRSATFY